MELMRPPYRIGGEAQQEQGRQIPPAILRRDREQTGDQVANPHMRCLRKSF